MTESELVLCGLLALKTALVIFQQVTCRRMLNTNRRLLKLVHETNVSNTQLLDELKRYDAVTREHFWLNHPGVLEEQMALTKLKEMAKK
jgi:hypothetical protein